jgi:hypothetical protein
MSVIVPRLALRKLILVPILAIALLVVLVDAPASPPSWSGKAQMESGSTDTGGGKWAGTGHGRKIR